MLKKKRKAITEADKKVIDGWFDEAKKMSNVGELKDFVDRLMRNYDHDYGTICHALAAAAIAAMTCIDHSPQGGITGFQASCIAWTFLDRWGVFDKGPKRMMCYANMLYPQYETKFAPTITKETWEWLQKEAKAKLKERGNGNSWDASVLAHIKSVADGKIPFGYTLNDSD